MLAELGAIDLEQVRGGEGPATPAPAGGTWATAKKWGRVGGKTLGALGAAGSAVVNGVEGYNQTQGSTLKKVGGGVGNALVEGFHDMTFDALRVNPAY